MQPIVSVNNFSLRLSGSDIINNLSFEVMPGEVFAFLGANGSGKTSTIRALLNIYSPTSGTLHIDGKTYTPAMSNLVGYIPEERGLYSRSKALDVMVYFGELKGMARQEAKDYSLEYLDRVGLSGKANQKVKSLSGGEQQKIQLGVATMNSPRLLILDEPTKGLDPVNRKLLIEMLEEARRGGAAIIYITHLMEEVERLADRVMIIKNGERKAYGQVKELKRDFGKKTIEDIFIDIYGSKS